MGFLKIKIPRAVKLPGILLAAAGSQRDHAVIKDNGAFSNNTASSKTGRTEIEIGVNTLFCIEFCNFGTHIGSLTQLVQSVTLTG